MLNGFLSKIINSEMLMLFITSLFLNKMLASKENITIMHARSTDGVSSVKKIKNINENIKIDEAIFFGKLHFFNIVLSPNNTIATCIPDTANM